MELDFEGARADTMTDEQIHAAALADPDARPLTPERLARMKPVPRTIGMRRALRLTREAFAARYDIPLPLLTDWEEGRAKPDAAAEARLRDISRDPAIA